MPDDPGEAQAEPGRRDRCVERSVHPARRAGLHSVGQRPEFIAQAVRDRIAAAGARTAYIEPGSPWDGGGSENSPGDCFPDDGRLRKRLGKAGAAGEDARERV